MQNVLQTLENGKLSPDLDNSTFSSEFAQKLQNVATALNQLNNILQASFFLDYVENYPQIMDEDVRTRLAHDLMRNLGEWTKTCTITQTKC